MNLEFIQQIGVSISLILIVILNPLADAIRDNGNKKRQKNLEILRDFMYFVIIFLLTFNLDFTLMLGAAMFFIRYAVHDIIYNLTRGLPIDYIGTTSSTSNPSKKIRDYAGFRRYIGIKIFSFLLGLLCLYIAIVNI